MYLVTAQQMRQIDSRASSVYHIPEIVLMENAGRAVTDFLTNQFTDLKKQNITIIVGSGNNGGDGLVIARYLHKLGVAVKIFLAGEKELSPSAQVNLEIMEKLPVKMYRLDTENSMHLFKVTVNYTDILIDAMLGTGIDRELSPLLDQVVDIINKRSCIKVAVDLPTGLNSDTGEIYGSCLKADYTVGLALPKRGHYLNKGLKYCGQVTIVDIGIPDEALAEEQLDCQLLDRDYLSKNLRKRERNSHKGSYGHLLVVGGSMGMSGAVTLAAQSALRSGVGVVSCAVPGDIQLHVAVNVPEAMVYPLNGGQVFASENLEELQYMLKGKKAIVVGPGMGKGDGARAVLEQVLENRSCPVVLDADGLNLLEGRLDLLQAAQSPIVLTPHPGEMARLTGYEVGHIQTNRIEVAQEFAVAHQVWVILKGANTIIAAPTGKVYMNIIDSPALAVAGSGDVLAGILGACLAQGLSADIACCLAVRLHGQAGLSLADRTGTISSKASDLIDELPNLLRGDQA